MGQPRDGHGIDPARDDTGTGTGTGTYFSSVPNGTEAGAQPLLPDVPPLRPRKVLSPEEQVKSEVWKAAVSVLEHGGCPPSQCRTFMGKLVTDYGFPIVKDAIAAAVSTQPADAREYLKATCQRLKGERLNRQEALEQRGQSVVDDWATGGKP